MPSIITKIFVEAYFIIASVSAKGGFGAFLLNVSGAALLSTIASKLFGPKVPSDVGLKGVQVMTRSALEYRKIVYGQAMVSGPLYYNNVSGDNREYLWYGVALCDGLSEDLVEVWFDGDSIPKADISWTAGTGASDGTGTGDVSTAKWVGDNSTGAVNIWYYLGDDAQPVPGVLDTAFADIGTNHRLRGVTHLVVRLLYDADTERVWKEGAPNNIKVVIKGRKIYDPRLDGTQIIDSTTSPITYGTGAHRTSDDTTWAWSENPSLCIADYLMTYMGVAATSIDWESVASAADDCEVSVAIPTASTEDRFTCNGALSLGSSHKDNLDAILSSMAGRLSYSGGVWTVRASVWEASSVSIDADDIAGDVDVRGSSPKAERFNAVRGFFIDPDRNYESAEFPHVIDTDYQTRDNSESIFYDLALPMTNSETMAQRIAFRNLEQSDNQIVCKLTMNARGAKIAVGDVASITLDDFSWASKTFRCIEWMRNAEGTFDVTFKEDTSARYTDPIEGDYSSTNTGGVTVPAEVVPPPSSLAATGVVGGIHLTWTNPPAAEFEFIDIYEDTDDNWAGATLVATVRSNTYVVPHTSGTTYYYWIRATRPPDQESLREPNSDTTTISAAATAGADGDDAVAVNYTNNSHAVPVTNTGTETWTGSGGLFYVFEGTTLLTLDTNTQGTAYPVTASRFRLDITAVSGDTLTEPTITGSGTTTATLSDWAGDLTTATVYRVTAYITTADSTNISIQEDITLSPSNEGDDGSPGNDGDDAFAISYTNQAHAIPVDVFGTETWTGSGGLFYAYEGGTVLTLNSNTQTASHPAALSRYNLDITAISGDTLTEPAITGSGTTTATIADWAGDLTQVTVYRITAYINAADGTDVTLSTDVTITPAVQGEDGNAVSAWIDPDFEVEAAGTSDTWETSIKNGTGGSGASITFAATGGINNGAIVTIDPGDGTDGTAALLVRSNKRIKFSFATFEVRVLYKVTGASGTTFDKCYAELYGYSAETGGTATKYDTVQFPAFDADGNWHDVRVILDGSFQTTDQWFEIAFDMTNTVVDSRTLVIDSIYVVPSNTSFSGAGVEKIGLVPDPVSEAGKFLKDDGTWADAVTTTGTPANNQVAIFTDADTVEGDADLTFDGTNLTVASRLRTQTRTGTGQTSTIEGQDHAGNWHMVDFMGLPRASTNNSNVTLSAEENGKVWDKTSGTAYTVTLEANTSEDFPVNGVVVLMNKFSSGDVTISEGTGTTLYYLEPGTGRTDTAGGCTLGVGGVAWLRRAAAGTYDIWGWGITP